MSLNHVNYCNCAECIARYGLGPRPPRPAPAPPSRAELELERAIAGTAPRVTVPGASPAPKVSIEMNDPDLERLLAANADRELETITADDVAVVDAAELAGDKGDKRKRR